MNIFEKDTHEGRFLTVLQEPEMSELDMKLIESLDNRYILRPLQGAGTDGGLRFNISGCEKLEQYLVNRRMDRTELVGFLAQMKSVIRAAEDHMLTDANILFDPAYVYIDRATRKVRFVPVCRMDGEFGDRLRPLAEKLFCHADLDDTESLRFAAQMMRTVLEGNLKMHTLMELADTVQPVSGRGLQGVSETETFPEREYIERSGEEATVLLSDRNSSLLQTVSETKPPADTSSVHGVKGFFSNFVSRFKEDDDDEE